MANTVHGPYTASSFSAGGSFASGDANKLGTQAGIALASFNPDLITSGFILSGVTCTKDNTTASQLDVASGRAYLIMSDGTLARIDVASVTFSASGHASSTMFLDLNPDGSWSWATTHSAVANHLTICSVTTDGSSNVSGVTDLRPTTINLFGGKSPTTGALALPAPLNFSQSAATVMGGVTFGQSGPSGDGSTAARFDGSTGFLDVAGSGLPSGNAGWTLECWVKLPSTPANYSIAVMIGDFTVTHGAGYIGFQNTGNPYIQALGGNSTGGGTPLTNNVWHHMVGTYDGTTIALYVDGALAGSTAAGVTLALPSGATIGATDGAVTGGTFPLNGTLAEVAIYAGAMSSTRISAHYSAISGQNYAATVLTDSPLRYMRLGDAAGSVAAADQVYSQSVRFLHRDGSFNAPGNGVFGGAVSAQGYTASQELSSGSMTAFTLNRTGSNPHTYYQYIDGSGGWGLWDSTAGSALLSGNVSSGLTVGGPLYANLGGGPLSAVGSASSLTLSGTPADVPGCTLTIATAGTYLVIGSVYCDIGGSGTNGQAVIYLNVNGTRQNLTGELSMATAATNMTLNANVTQSWIVTVGAGQVVKLQASGSTGFANVVPNGGTVASSITAQYLHS